MVLFIVPNWSRLSKWVNGLGSLGDLVRLRFEVSGLIHDSMLTAEEEHFLF